MLSQVSRVGIMLTVMVIGFAPALAEPPNVILLISDDQAWTDYGFMGHEAIQTPHLDKLASESALFINGYVPTSLCRPSLATLISGQYPHEHKITGNDPPKGMDRNELLVHIEQCPKLPELLAGQGYVSHQSGKWWEGNFRTGGFTAGMTHGDTQRGGRHGDEGLKIGRQGLEPIWNFVDTQQDKPFFLWYAPFLPHTPHNPPGRLLKKYQIEGRPIELVRYYAMCEWFDETCGELLAGLEDRGLSENTLVVYVTDNGWIQPTPKSDLPEGWRHPFAPRSKRSPHEGGVRTPIMLRWPGKIAPQRYDTLVSSIDLAPTILHAAGIIPPQNMSGIDLLHVIQNNGQTDRKTLFGEIFEHDMPDIHRPESGLLYRWCRHGDWKLILPINEKEKLEFYHLKNDPHEKTNLANQQPERVRQLASLIDSWWNPSPVSP